MPNRNKEANIIKEMFKREKDLINDPSSREVVAGELDGFASRLEGLDVSAGTPSAITEVILARADGARAVGEERDRYNQKVADIISKIPVNDQILLPCAI